MAQLCFQRHRSKTQLNWGQPKLCPLVSSKHLRCPKSVQEEAGGHENKPVRATGPYLCPTSPHRLCEMPAFDSDSPCAVSSAFCARIVPLLAICSKEAIILAPPPPSPEQTPIEICVRSNNVCMDPHRAQLKRVCQSLVCLELLINTGDNERT